MKAYITDRGDPSVGIRSATATIDFPFKDINDLLQWQDLDREQFRKELKEFFEDKVFGDKVSVLFEGECPDCGHDRLENHPCSNSNCISGLPDDMDF